MVNPSLPPQGLVQMSYLSDDAANILHDTLRALDHTLDTHVRELDYHVAGIRERSEAIDKLYGERSSLAAELSQKVSPEWTPREERDTCAMPPSMPGSHRPQRFQRPHPLSRG